MRNSLNSSYLSSRWSGPSMASRVLHRLAGCEEQHVSHRNGFSLVELLVVLAFIGVALGVGIPLVNDQIRIADVRQVADNFATSVRAARMIAVAKHKSITFTVNVDPTNTYSYEKTDGTQRLVALPVQTQFATGSTASFTFKSDGSVSPAATVYIRCPVSNSITEQWLVNVNSIGLVDMTHSRF
jgi:prepilin-type N-terminal cleavage/methylation domain-containing protein